MTKCKGCGDEFRKGQLVMLLVSGKLSGARVCRECAADGVTIVAPKLAPVVKRVADRNDGVQRALRQLRTLASAAKASAGAARGDACYHQQGRLEGIEGAIEAIKRECRVGQ